MSLAERCQGLYRAEIPLFLDLKPPEEEMTRSRKSYTLPTTI